MVKFRKTCQRPPNKSGRTLKQRQTKDDDDDDDDAISPTMESITPDFETNNSGSEFGLVTLTKTEEWHEGNMQRLWKQN